MVLCYPLVIASEKHQTESTGYLSIFPQAESLDEYQAGSSEHSQGLTPRHQPL